MRNLLFTLLLFSCIPLSAQNRWIHGERTGRWTVYYDDNNKQVDNTGRYRKGIPRGKWKYYHENGALKKIEIIRFGKIRTRMYYENGKLWKTGQAKMELNEKEYHYYFYGYWKVYDSLGNALSIDTYEKGNRIAQKLLKLTNGRNDSVVAALRSIDSILAADDHALAMVEAKEGRNSEKYRKLQSFCNLRSIQCLNKLDTIITRYGYPGKTIAGDDYAIAFSIISRASLDYKRTFYDAIVKAADLNELPWSDVAFFVDKVLVAEKKPQLYGTQFILGDHDLIYYPIADKKNLDERRKKAGLPEMDPAFNDSAPY